MNSRRGELPGRFDQRRTQRQPEVHDRTRIATIEVGELPRQYAREPAQFDVHRAGAERAGFKRRGQPAEIGRRQRRVFAGRARARVEQQSAKFRGPTNIVHAAVPRLGGHDEKVPAGNLDRAAVGKLVRRRSVDQEQHLKPAMPMPSDARRALRPHDGGPLHEWQIEHATGDDVFGAARLRSGSRHLRFAMTKKTLLPVGEGFRRRCVKSSPVGS